jgi:hypothetical protein
MSEEVGAATAVAAAVISDQGQPSTEIPDQLIYPGPKVCLFTSNKRYYVTPTGQSTFNLSANGGDSLNTLTFNLPTNIMADSSTFQLAFSVTQTAGPASSFGTAVYCVWNNGFDFFRKFKIQQGGGPALYETDYYNNAAAISSMHLESSTQVARAGVQLENRFMGVGPANDTSPAGLLSFAHKGRVLGWDSDSTRSYNNVNNFTLNLKDGIFASKKILPLQNMSQLQLEFTFETTRMAIKCMTGTYNGNENWQINNIRLYYRAVTIPATLAAAVTRSVVQGGVALPLVAVEAQTATVPGNQLNANLQFNWRVSSLDALAIIFIDQSWATNEQMPNIGNFSSGQLSSAWFRIGSDYYPPQLMESYRDYFTNLEDFTGNTGNTWDVGLKVGRLRAMPSQGLPVNKGPFTTSTTILSTVGPTYGQSYPNLWMMYHDAEYIDFDPATGTPANLAANNFETWDRNGFLVAMSFQREQTPGVVAGINTANATVNTEFVMSRTAGAAQNLFLICYGFFQKWWNVKADGMIQARY